jgi:hypothetical protein
MGREEGRKKIPETASTSPIPLDSRLLGSLGDYREAVSSVPAGDDVRRVIGFSLHGTRVVACSTARALRSKASETAD